MDRRERPSREAAGSRGSAASGWTPRQAEVLAERRRLAWAAQHAYFERASILQTLNYLIGVPVVLITALSASEIVASRAVDEPVPLWVGLITVSATVLASLQTFFRFGERAAFNAQAGHRYAVLRRRLEDALVQTPEDGDERFDEMRKEWEKIGEQSPPIGERRWLTWQSYAAREHVPRRRSLWGIVLGVPERERRRSRRPGEDPSKSRTGSSGDVRVRRT